MKLIKKIFLAIIKILAFILLFLFGATLVVRRINGVDNPNWRITMLVLWIIIIIQWAMVLL